MNLTPRLRVLSIVAAVAAVSAAGFGVGNTIFRSEVNDPKSTAELAGPGGMTVIERSLAEIRETSSAIVIARVGDVKAPRLDTDDGKFPTSEELSTEEGQVRTFTDIHLELIAVVDAADPAIAAKYGLVAEPAILDSEFGLDGDKKDLLATPRSRKSNITLTVPGGRVDFELTAAEANALGMTSGGEDPERPVDEPVQLAFGRTPPLQVAEGDVILAMVDEVTLPASSYRGEFTYLTLAHPTGVLHKTSDGWRAQTADGELVDLAVLGFDG